MGFGVCVYDSMDFSGIGYEIFGVGACVSERRAQKLTWRTAWEGGPYTGK
jgi:hypothetical protein